MWSFRQHYRQASVLARRALGVEPRIRETVRLPLEFHGNAAGGWNIVRGSLDAASIVVDVGLGEDAAFSQSIARTYGCIVNGFDPTPRAIHYIKGLSDNQIRLFGLGLGISPGPARFFLPNNAAHVSGSVNRERHLGQQTIEVDLVTLGQVFDLLNSDRIDPLKLDIEGSEFDLIGSAEFERYADRIGQLCIEFHHRWKGRGKRSTQDACEVLNALGFRCAWYSRSTNEEFLFVRSPPR